MPKVTDPATPESQAREHRSAAVREMDALGRETDAALADIERILGGHRRVRHLRVVGSEPARKPAPAPEPLATVIPFPR